MPTTTTISIGAGQAYSGVTGIQDAITAFPNKDLVGQDISVVFEIDNSLEYLRAGGPVASLLAEQGWNVDTTHFVTLRAKAGKAARQNATVGSNALAYNAANGVALRSTGSDTTVFVCNLPYTVLDGLQFKGNSYSINAVHMPGSGCTIKNCILEGFPTTDSYVANLYGTASKAFNSLILSRQPSTRGLSVGNGSIVSGMTIALISDQTGGIGIVNASNDSDAFVTNTAIVGFSQTGANKLSGTNNATTAATFPTNVTGMAAQVYANLFIGNTNASTDYRLKAGSPLIDAGVTTPYTESLSGATRPSGSTFDIGAWEVPAAPASKVMMTGPADGTTGYPAILRFKTDTPLTGNQTQTGSFTDSAGGTFDPAAPIIDVTTQFVDVIYTPTTPLGLRTISVSATGTPALAASTFAFTVAAPVPASTVTLDAPTTGVVGTSINLTISTDHPLTSGQSISVAVADGAGGTVGAPVTINSTTLSKSMPYTANGAPGSRTLTATPTGTPALAAATASVTFAAPAPAFVSGDNVWTVGAGQQFATANALMVYLAGKSFPAISAKGKAYFLGSTNVSSGDFSGTILSDQFNLEWLPFVGQGYRDLEPGPARDYPSVGAELVITGNVNFPRGLTVRNMRIKHPDASTIYWGISQANARTTAVNCRFLITNPGSTPNGLGGASYAQVDFFNNLVIREAGSGPVFSFGDGSGDMTGNTFGVRGTATSSGVKWGAYGGGGNIQGNAFEGCGDEPIVIDPANNDPAKFNVVRYKGNVTNQAMNATKTKMSAGITAAVQATMVQNKASDWRPANPGPLFGTAPALLRATNDNVGSNRGLSPDVGAFQLVPAQVLPSGAITSIAVSGQTVTVSLVVTNAVSGVISLVADSTAPAGAISRAEVPLSITGGTATAVFTGVPGGFYSTSPGTVTNPGGTIAITGGYPVRINAIEGLPEMPATAGGGGSVPTPPAPTVTSVVVTPSAATLPGQGTQQFAAAVTGTNGPSQAVTWTASAGNISASGAFTAPVGQVGVSQTIAISATSAVDASKSGFATVTVQAAGAPVPTVTAVSVVPPTATVQGGATSQLAAIVTGTNSPSQSVAWTTSGGNITIGGLFTAPAATAVPQDVTVTATSDADPTKSAVSHITVPASAILVPSVVSVAVVPVSATVVEQATKQFTATVVVMNGAGDVVSWSSSAGQITSTGLFTAPPAINVPRVLTVTATSAVDPTKSGVATVTVPATSVAIFNGPHSIARLVKCADPQPRDGHGAFWNTANPEKLKGRKDPEATIDIPFDWIDWFADTGDAYASHSFSTTGDLALRASGFTAGVATAVVSGGTRGAVAQVTCTIRSNSVPPRVDERTVYLTIKDR